MKISDILLAALLAVSTMNLILNYLWFTLC